MACNKNFGSPGEGVEQALVSPFMLRRCELGRFNAVRWALYWDAYVLSQLEADMAREGAASERSWADLLLAELNRFCNTIDIDGRGTWDAARAILTPLYANRAGGRVFELSAIGHAHIDTAWLWPLAETFRKCARTFSTALAYMRDYPEYRFACSQAFQYAAMREHYPELYARMRAFVRNGQTQELSWNRFNKPQHHTFIWRGIDGSEVTTHFPPADTYNSLCASREYGEILQLRQAERNFRDHDRSHVGFMLFDYGDGGGPTKPMLTVLRRVGDLQGLPRASLPNWPPRTPRRSRTCCPPATSPSTPSPSRGRRSSNAMAPPSTSRRRRWARDARSTPRIPSASRNRPADWYWRTRTCARRSRAGGAS
jgi:hypothetical protein